MKKKNLQTGSTIFLISSIIAVLIAFSFVILSPHRTESAVSSSQAILDSEGNVVTIAPYQATATALPENYPNLIPDYFDNQNETDGVIIGGALLILIILLGVFFSKRNNEK